MPAVYTEEKIRVAFPEGVVLYHKGTSIRIGTSTGRSRRNHTTDDMRVYVIYCDGDEGSYRADAISVTQGDGTHPKRA